MEPNLIWDRVAERYGIDPSDSDWLGLRAGYDQLSRLFNDTYLGEPRTLTDEVRRLKAVARQERSEKGMNAFEQVCHDIHHKLGVEWGQDVYGRIDNLRAAEAQVTALKTLLER